MQLYIFSILAVTAQPPRWHELTSAYSYAEYSADFGKEQVPLEHPRVKAFNANVKAILQHNAELEQTYKMGVNHFTDMTPEQFQQERMASPAVIASARRAAAASAAAPASAPATAAALAATDGKLPASVDYRAANPPILTAVKDQGGCGSCWAFASTEMIETYAAMSVKPYSLADLSPQQLVACSPNPNDCGGIGGCDGSVPELAFDYVKANGMTTEWYMPYTAHAGGCAGQPGQPGCPCTYNATSMKTVTLEGYTKLPANDMASTMAALAVVGPLAVNVQANTWQHYEEGIFPTADCGKGTDGVAIDHVVQLVGYTADSWIIRNSWTPQWGVQGFIYLERAESNATMSCANDNTPGDGVGCTKGPSPTPNSTKVCGTCGVLYDVSYPTGVNYYTKPAH